MWATGKKEDSHNQLSPHQAWGQEEEDGHARPPPHERWGQEEEDDLARSSSHLQWEQREKSLARGAGTCCRKGGDSGVCRRDAPTGSAIPAAAADRLLPSVPPEVLASPLTFAAFTLGQSRAKWSAHPHAQHAEVSLLSLGQC